ncbi:hypothetical protein D3C71_1885380 [compost metagenome]
MCSRTALLDFNIEAVFGVGAVSDSLIEAAMIGLGEPICAETDFIEGIGRCGEGDRRNRKRGNNCCLAG